MGILQDELHRAMGELWSKASLMTEVLRRILKNRGITFSDDQVQALVQPIIEGSDSVDVPGEPPAQIISITEDDIDRAIHELETTHDADAERAIIRLVEDLTPRVLQSLYETLPQSLQEWHSAKHAFEEQLHNRWKEGLDRLEMIVTMAHEAGETYIADIQRESAEDKHPPEPVLIDALAALHCRACRTAREIVCLLKAGYADGAHARWRSLHELAVIANFLLEHRENTPQRYLDHAIVERFRAAKLYQAHCQTLGYDPCSDEEMTELKKASDAAIAKYGDDFWHDYGWAAEVLKISRPNFSQIEASLDMAHWRPWFRLACQSVHAGSQSLHFALGIPHDGPAMLLAGASDAGLAEPGHQTAISLTMATAAFLTAYPNLDGIVACQCMLRVCDDIGRELLQANEATDEATDASFDPT